MPQETNLDQLKEFFTFRLTIQDREIKDIKDDLKTVREDLTSIQISIPVITESIKTKVGVMWKVMGAFMLIILTATATQIGIK